MAYISTSGSMAPLLVARSRAAVFGESGGVGTPLHSSSSSSWNTQCKNAWRCKWAYETQVHLTFMLKLRWLLAIYQYPIGHLSLPTIFFLCQRLQLQSPHNFITCYQDISSSESSPTSHWTKPAPPKHYHPHFGLYTLSNISSYTIF